MSPDFKEIPPVTEESCLEFIRSLMSRNFKTKELLGIKSLIDKYGPEEIQGQAADLMLEAEQFAAGKKRKKKITIDKYVKKCSLVYRTIPEWMTRRIERQNQNRNEDTKAVERVPFQILTSLNDPSASSIVESVRLLSTIFKN